MPVWDPHLIKHTELLEKVQKFALKVCTKSWNSSYSSLLSQTDLPQFDQRRVQLKLSFLYQLINNLAFCPHAPIAFRNVSVNVRSNNPLLLFRPVCRTNSHYHSFYPSTIALWNATYLILLLVHHPYTLLGGLSKVLVEKLTSL